MSIGSNEIPNHISRCSSCINRQEIIELLEQRHRECLEEKKVIRNNISHHIHLDNCELCSIIDKIIMELYEMQENCFNNSFCDYDSREDS